MRLRLAIIAVLLACFGAGKVRSAPGGCGVANQPSFDPFAFEQITVSTTAVGFTATKYAPSGGQPAFLAVVAVEDNAIRSRDDGLNPTSSVGTPFAADTFFSACGTSSIRAVRFIRSGGADATLSVSYYRTN